MQINQATSAIQGHPCCQGLPCISMKCKQQGCPQRYTEIACNDQRCANTSAVRQTISCKHRCNMSSTGCMCRDVMSPESPEAPQKTHKQMQYYPDQPAQPTSWMLVHQFALLMILSNDLFLQQHMLNFTSTTASTTS